MEFLYFLGGLIALLLGTDTAMKGFAGALQQGGLSPLRTGLALVFVAYAFPGLVVVLGAAAWQDVSVAATVAHGAALGTLGFGAAGLLVSTGVVLRVRPWKVLDDDKARAELAEFAASREGWTRNLFRLGLGLLLLVLGARGLLAAGSGVALVPGADGLGAAGLPVAFGVGAAVGIVATFNARFGDAAAAFSAILGGGLVLTVVAVGLALITATPAFSISLALLAHPLVQGLILLVALLWVARPVRPIGRGAGLLLMSLTALALFARMFWAS